MRAHDVEFAGDDICWGRVVGPMQSTGNPQ